MTLKSYVRYLVAPVAVALALLCRLSLNPYLHDASPFMFFFAAIMVSSWLGGFGPGLVATVLSTLAISYFYLTPQGSFLINNPKELFRIVPFIILGVVVSAIIARMRLEKKRAIQAAYEARLNEIRYRATYEYADIGIERIDEQGRLLEGNPALCRMLGYTGEELIGRTYTEITHPDDCDEECRLLEQLKRREIPSFRMEKRYLRKDGQPLWVRVTSSLAPEGSGFYRISLIEDILERKRAVDAQREAVERYERQVRLFEGITSTTPDFVYVFDRQGRFLYANRRLLEVLGLQLPEAIGKTCCELGYEQWHHDMHMREIAQVIETKAPIKGEVPFKAPRTGIFGIYEYIFTPVLGPDGEVESIAGTTRDVTDRKQAEAALRDSHERLKKVLEVETVGVMFWDLATGSMTDANDTFLKMMGYSRQDVESGELTWQKLTPPEYLEASYAEIGKFQSNGRIGPYEKEYFRKDGTRQWLVFAGSSLGENACVEFCVDISARKQAEAALRQANEQLLIADRHKDEFLAMLAHELRNPISPVRSAVEIMRITGSQDPILIRQRDIIERQITHMARLLDDLLDVSRVTRGKIALKTQPLHLNDVLVQAVETAMPLIESRRHEFILKRPPDSLRVEADPDRLAQVIGNLLANAAKYSDEGGRIWLEAAHENGHAVIRVRDTGAGIAPEMLPRVFDLFAQADQSLARAKGGLGIGLTMAKKLVELHGGTIEAHSEGLGRGSEFIVCLPALPMEVGASRKPAIPRKGLVEIPPRRILVVDDIADSADSLAQMLSLSGHETCVAYDGPSALKLFCDFGPSVVLLDIGMPGMDGYEVARRIRQYECGRQTMLIALTGYAQESARDKAKAAGFDYHLAKPVDLDALRELLASHEHRSSRI